MTDEEVLRFEAFVREAVREVGARDLRDAARCLRVYAICLYAGAMRHRPGRRAALHERVTATGYVDAAVWAQWAAQEYEERAEFLVSESACRRVA